MEKLTEEELGFIIGGSGNSRLPDGVIIISNDVEEQG